AKRPWLRENAFFHQVPFNVVVHAQSLISARTFQGKRALPPEPPACGWSNVVGYRLDGPQRVGKLNHARTVARRVFHTRSTETGAESVRSSRSAGGYGGCT